MSKVVCEDCNRVFEGTARARYCPVCRKRRQSEAAKRRNLSELGHEGYRQKIARLGNGT